MSQDEPYLKAKCIWWVMTRQRVHQKMWQKLFPHNNSTYIVNMPYITIWYSFVLKKMQCCLLCLYCSQMST